MTTVMIVEDEAIVRIGLQTIIDWGGHGYELIGVYANGLQAWEAIQRSTPDILLTDIRMPEMDGLQLISKIRERNSLMNIVILSSYDDFDYTRKAIQLNAQDYLIKHKLDPDKIIETLKTLPIHTADEARQLATDNRLDLEKRRFLKQTGETSGDTFSNPSDGTSFPLLSQQLDAPGDKWVWITVRPVPKTKDYLDSELRAATVLLDEIVQRFESYVFLGMDEGRFHILKRVGGRENAEIYRAIDDWITRELYPPFRDKLSISLYTGVGGISCGMDALRASRHGAEIALKQLFYGGSSIFYSEKAGRPRNLNKTEWLACLNQTKEFLWNEDMSGLCGWIEDQAWLAEEPIESSESIRLCLMVVFRFIDMVLDRYQIDLLSYEGSFKADSHKLKELDTAESWNVLTRLTRELLESGAKTVEEIHTNNGWLKKAMEYIDEHYMEPFRQEDVAKHVNFSVNYFSHRFHQETGFSFSDYVTRRRINKAIELVNQQVWSTEEITEKVGYSNPNYFIKQFKKVTGSTWSEFKRKKKNLQ